MPVAEQMDEPGASFHEKWFFVTSDYDACERYGKGDEACDTECFDTYDEAAMVWLTTHGIIDLTPPTEKEIKWAREYVEAHPEIERMAKDLLAKQV